MAALRRELYGIVQSGNTPVFKKDVLKKTFEAPRYKFPWNATEEMIFVAIDPSGGATGSDTAVISLCYNEEGDAVVRFHCVYWYCPYGSHRITYRARPSHTRWRGVR